MRRCLIACLAAAWLSAATLALASSGGAGTVSFAPLATYPGAKVHVHASARRGQVLEVYLARHRGMAGAIGAGSIRGGAHGWADASVRVAPGTAPGRYFVLACRHGHCLISARRLLVKRRRLVVGTGSGGTGSGGSGSGSGSSNSGGSGSGNGVQDNVQYQLRLATDMPLSWSPTPQPPPVSEPHGTGSADYQVAATVTLSGDPTSDGATGSGPLEWTKFAYSDQNVQELCQSGQYQPTTFSSTGADPGTLTVSSLKIASPTGTSPDPGVTLEMQLAQPTEHIRVTFAQVGACPAATIDQTRHDWAALYLPQATYAASGVSGFAADPSSPSRYNVTGWRRASGPAGGNGTLVAVKSFSYPIKDYEGGNGNPGGTGTGHVALQIVSIPQTP